MQPTAFKEHLWKAVFVLAALFALTMAILPQPPMHGEVPDKWLHVLAFTILTVLARLAFPRAHALSMLLGLSMLGGLIELIQAIPALGRDANLADWAGSLSASMGWCEGQGCDYPAKTFSGLWMAHTAFGLPLAIFLLRNYIAGLPRELMESARLDGASHLHLSNLLQLEAGLHLNA